MSGVYVQSFTGLFFLLFSVLALIIAVVVLTIQQRKLRHIRDALLQEKEVIYGFVHDVSEVFADSDHVDLDLMLKRVLFYAMRTTQAGSGALYIFETGRETLRARAITGIFPPLAGEIDRGIDRAMSKSHHIHELVKNRLIRKGEGLIGTVADLGVATLIEDAETDPRVPHYDLDFLSIKSIIAVPMRFHQNAIGVLVVVNPVDGRPFAPSDLNILQSLADQASVSVHYADLRETLDEKQRMDHDLSIARRIQTSLLPKELPHVEGVELAAFNYPALEIGGDYYDIVQVDKNHLGIAIADVSGKGIGGGIMMSVCRSVLRAQAPGNLSPASVLRSVNRVVSQDITEDMFISMLYMVLNISTRELTVTRAGHERPILSSLGQKSFTFIESPGMAMGLTDNDMFDRVLEEVRISLKPGDVIVVYTDGVTEAMNPQGEEWGVDNLINTIKVAADEGANSVLNNVRQRLVRFVGNRAQYDDMTLLAMRILK